MSSPQQRQSRHEITNGQHDDVGENDNSADENDGGIWRRTLWNSISTDDDITLQQQHKTNQFQTFVHLLKGYVGPGCLSLPWSLSILGLKWGILAIFVMSCWTSWNSWQVVQLKRRIIHHSHHPTAVVAVVSSDPSSSATEATATTVSATPIPTTHDDDDDDDDGHQPRIDVEEEDDDDEGVIVNLAQTATYPQVSGYYISTQFENVTSICICIQQMSICTVFFSFVGVNLRAVLSAILNLEHSDSVSHVTVITCVLPAALALVCVPDLKALAPFTILATVLLMLGFSTIGMILWIEYNNNNDNDDSGQQQSSAITAAAAAVVDDNNESNSSTSSWQDLPLALCAILYSYEGICLVLPVETSMKQPDRFVYPFVQAMVLSAIIFAIVSGLSVSVFGNVTNGSLTAFLLQKYIHDGNNELRDLLYLANAFVSFSVLLTYPLQLFPCLELVGGPWWTSSFSSSLLRFYSNKRRGRGRHDFEAIAVLADADGQQANKENDKEESRTQDNNDEQQRQQQEEPDALYRLSLNNDHQSVGHENNNNSNNNSDPVCPQEDMHASTATTAATSTTTTTTTTTVRVGLVLFTYICAVAIPNVESLISLSGALAGSSTALLIPPILVLSDLCNSCHRPSSSSYARNLYYCCTSPECLLYILLFLLGVLFTIIGTAASIQDIIKSYET